jgi:type II secretory pathway pseudopilin PulG
MKACTQQKHRGYSMVEMLVYLAIFSVMSIVVIDSFTTVTRSFDTTHANRDLLESGEVAMEHMSREIRESTNTNVLSSTFGTNPGLLSLSSIDGSGNGRTVIFTLENSTLDMYQNGTLVGSLLDSNVSISNLIFRRIVTPKGEAIKIEMTLTTTSSTTPAQANFYDTIILRGEYSGY